MVSPASGTTQHQTLDTPGGMGWSDHRSWDYSYTQAGITPDRFSVTTSLNGVPYETTNCTSRPGGISLLTGAKPGDHVQNTEDCQDTINGASVETGTGEVTGTEDLRVGATHVMTVVVSWHQGSSSSSGTETDWLVPSSGLLVQAIVSTDSTSGSQTTHTSAQVYLQDLMPS